MYRVRIALIAAAVVAVATVAVFLYVRSDLDRKAMARVEARALRAQEQLLMLSRLEGVDLANQTLAFAREDEFVQIFSKPDEDERRRVAHIAVEVRNARLEKAGRKAGIIGVVDEQGLLVSRDLSPTWRYRDNLKKDYPALAMALAGRTNKDIWNLDGAMYRVGSAPILGPQGNILGAVFVGYVQSVQDARAAEEMLATDVAYFLDGKIHASSFQRAGGSRSETAEEKALVAHLFEGKHAEKVVTAHEKTPIFRVNVGGDEYVAAAAPIPGNATPSKSGFVVLASVSEARRELMGATTAILLLGLFAVLAAVGAAVMTARRFLDPLDRVEAGVSEVINGNRDYVFESPSPDFEGLANGLNVMLARLLGRPEPGEDEESDEEREEMRSFEQ